MSMRSQTPQVGPDYNQVTQVSADVAKPEATSGEAHFGKQLSRCVHLTVQFLRHI